MSDSSNFEHYVSWRHFLTVFATSWITLASALFFVLWRVDDNHTDENQRIRTSTRREFDQIHRRLNTWVEAGWIPAEEDPLTQD